MCNHYHETRKGKKIALPDMEDSDLMSCIRFFLKRIREGVTIYMTLPGGPVDNIGESFTPPTRLVRGQELADMMGVRKYAIEAYRRGLIGEDHPITDYA